MRTQITILIGGAGSPKNRGNLVRNSDDGVPLPLILDPQFVQRFIQPTAKDRTSTVTSTQGTPTIITSAVNTSQAISPLNNTDSSSLRKPYAGSLDRIPWVLTSDQWILENKALALHAGPNSAQWNLALRASNESVPNGSARFASRRFAPGQDSTGTGFELPRVDFQFQAGNILPVYTGSGLDSSIEMPDGLQDFHNFLSLMNQPPFIGAQLSDGTSSGIQEGKKNYVWIFYTSLKFPKITLKGFFDPAGTSFSDTVEDPATVTWGATLEVHQATPNLWEPDAMQSSYLSYMRENVTFM